MHAQIEEEIFYPALRDATDAGELLDEAEAEHQEAKELIAELEAVTRSGRRHGRTGGRRWLARSSTT